MTTNNGPDDKKPGQGGKDHRPYATLDLTAKDVSPKDEASSAKSAEKPSSETKSGSSASSGEPPRLGKPDTAASPPPRDVSAASLASHLSAGALGAVLALIFGYSIFVAQETPAPPSVSPETVDALRAQLADADKKLAALEQNVRQVAAKADQPPPPSGDADELKSNLSALATRITTLEARPVAGAQTEQTVQQSLDPVTARLSEVEQRIQALAKSQSEMATDGKSAALALALYNLRRATNEGKPYNTELKSLADLAPIPLDLSGLQPRSDRGVLSLAELKADFVTAANAALDAENEPTDDSLSAEMWSQVKSFVRVRRKGNIPGDTPRAILARTEYRLENGELAPALKEVKQLGDAAAEAMKPWVSELEAKIEAEKALADVEAKLLTELGGGDSAKRGG